MMDSNQARDSEMACHMLSDWLHIPISELEDRTDEKLINIGIDSIQISYLYERIDPSRRPALLTLYNSTVRDALKLLNESANAQSCTGIAKEETSDVLYSKSTRAIFPLMDMQQSYYIGRYESTRFWPCQVYTELDFDHLDITALKQALRGVVAKHPMLRACVKDGHLQEIQEFDAVEKSIEILISNERDLQRRRADCMQAFKENPNCFWKVEATRLVEDGLRLHILMDMLFMDAHSAFLVCYDVTQAYNLITSGRMIGTYLPIEPPDSATFHQYCEQRLSNVESSDSVKYWSEIIEDMPGPPQLPTISSESRKLHNGTPFRRVSLRIDAETYDHLKVSARKLGVTTSAFLLGGFYDVLRHYSHDPNMSLTVTISDRSEYFANVVGEFTNVIILRICDGRGNLLQDTCKEIHNKLTDGMQHHDISGLKVMRQLRERRGDPNYTLPVVFTSLLGLKIKKHEFGSVVPSIVFQQTQTPQVWLDHQVYEVETEQGGMELVINLDYDATVYSSELMNEIRTAYDCCLHRMIDDSWIAKDTVIELAPEVKELRLRCNSTENNDLLSACGLLHDLFDAKKLPEKLAVVDQDVQLSYNDIDVLATSLSGRLQQAGVVAGDVVAIVMEKGWEQIVSVLAILRVGAIYLPLNPSHPDSRLSSIIKRTECRFVVTQAKVLGEREWMEGIGSTIVVSLTDSQLPSSSFTNVDISVDAPAYVIFTSGTEGVPKGVVIEHRSAVNTCLDINYRFGVTESDTVFAISSLSFDLSVWDIFGTFAALGTIVICKPNGTRDPKYWWDQVVQNKITVWNSVPTSFEMLMETCPSPYRNKLPLRTVLLSGDAIKMAFVRNVKQSNPHVRIICLGGATEASIWSNFHEINPCCSLSTELVPYGVPLSNQTLYVLDSLGEFRETNVVGSIYIGGFGLAKSYFKDLEKTTEKFQIHERFGRLYCTGDIGRYLPNGEVQIIGRRDAQVKIGGHRVELAEIEKCVEQLPFIKHAAVVLTSGSRNRLTGFVQLRFSQNSFEVEKAVRKHVAVNLPDYMVTHKWIVVDEIPVTVNGKVDRSKLQILTKAIGSQVNVEAAADNIALKNILNCAGEILGSTDHPLTVDASLIELGMTSLDSIRFTKRLSEVLDLDLPYTLVFNYPTVLQISNFVAAMKEEKVASSPSTNSSHNLVPEDGTNRNDCGQIPIAIVGMSCRLPGNVTNAEEFWSMLSQGKDCVGDVPVSRFSLDEVYDANNDTLDKCYTKRGAFMSDVEKFDNEFFGIPLAEAESMDPQQRLLLEVAYEAMLMAGFQKDSIQGSNTGVFVGQMNYDWMLMTETGRSYAGTGMAPSISANRISYIFGLHGPSMTVDTACSSSLVAVDLAVGKLRSRKCSQALVAGVNVILDPEAYMITCAAKMLSVNGRCATFDANADGIVRGEGVGCLMLKRLDDAVKSGDKVLALISGTAVNQDGRSATLTAPNGLAQQMTIRNALDDAGVKGCDVDFVECHGTGTNLGDPIEVEALSEVLRVDRRKPVFLGSVKTNIGHLEGAAGIVGLIKTVLVLQQRAIPPHLHLQTINPKLNFEVFNAVVPKRLTLLDSEHELVAGVSSFGFGGTNAHVILKSYQLSNPVKPHRKNGCVVWLYTGQGSQYAGMGRELYESNVIFRSAIDYCAKRLTSHLNVPLTSLLFDDAYKAKLERTCYSQVAIFCFEYAASEMWHAEGFDPNIVIGHSIGEYAAAVTSGVMSFDTALELVVCRGKCMEELCSPGSMAAVHSSAVEVMTAIGNNQNVAIAAINGPKSTTISGTTEDVRTLLSSIKAAHVLLPVNRACHSPLMHPMITSFEEKLQRASLHSPKPEITFISTLSGQPEVHQLSQTSYWLQQIVQPVNFMAAMLSVPVHETSNTFVEIGSKDILIPLAKHISNHKDHEWLSTANHDRSARGTQVPDTIFNRKSIPWTLPRPNCTNRAEQLSDYKINRMTSIYGTEWIPIPPASFRSRNSIQVGSICGNRCLLVSFNSISTAGTRWRNVVISNSSSESKAELADAVASENWENVLLAANDDDAVTNFGVALWLLQQVIRRNSSSFPTVWFLGNDLSYSRQAYASLSALARTAKVEVPELCIQCIECVRTKNAVEIAALCRFVQSHFIEKDFNFKVDSAINQLQVARLQKIRSASEKSQAGTRPIKIVSNAAYVITGGTGGLGLKTAEWLASQGAQYIMLLSRREPTHLESHLSELLGRRNVNVEWVKCDVRSLDEVKNVHKILSSLNWPTVAGIIHAAGILDDGTIRTINPDAFAEVYRTKVIGAQNLREVFKPNDFFILYSSAASVFGAAGQATYSAANASMDALADLWSRNGENVICIQWGPWMKVGMTVKAGEGIVQRLERSGLRGIPVNEAYMVLQTLLNNHKFGVFTAVSLIWSSIQGKYSVLEVLEKELSETINTAEKPERQILCRPPTLFDIKNTVGQVTHDILGTAIEDSKPLMEAGLTSLDSVSLTQHLSTLFPAVKFSSSLVFNYPTVDDLASYILTEIESVWKKQKRESDIQASILKWEKLNKISDGTPFFLIGGVLGTASGTFKKLAELLPVPVYATIPDLSTEGASVSSVAETLLLSMRKIHQKGKFIFGGLSFGAMIALEIACQLEEAEEYSTVDCLVLLDPRHTPPFQAPAENPAKFEIMLGSYIPRCEVLSRTVVIRANMPDFAALSPLLKEAARSFQSDEVVEANIRNWCPAMEILKCPGHHFKFMNMHHSDLANVLMRAVFGSNRQIHSENCIESDPIAIISMSCRLPGGIVNPEQFWQILMEGVDCTSDIPFSRFDMDDSYSPEVGHIGKSYTKRAGIIDDVEHFDCDAFSISYTEAKTMDPQQRVLLEVAYETFYNAGHDFSSLRGLNIGVFVGQANYDWMVLQKDENSSPYIGAGTSASITANRISYTLGLQGPSVTIDTACSSSLVALDLALEKMRAGKCSLALVGGVNIILNKNFFVVASATQALSATGRCATFDNSADGYCRGEGVGCVLLKRLSEAQRDGDNILAVIKGSSVNHDGRSSSLTAPNGLAQVKVINAALKEACVEGKDIDYVECHGTGTKLGDPIEVDALKRSLGHGRVKPVVLGAVKTNIGHLEGAAGIVGLIKAVLVLKHRCVPPNVHFSELNRNINLGDFEAVVPSETIHLQNPGLLLVGISSFGFGGTNAHVILEESISKYSVCKAKQPLLFKKKVFPLRRLTHPLIYHKVDVDTYQAEVSGERAAIWSDHKLDGKVIIPAASHLTMIAGAALELRKHDRFEAGHVVINDIVFMRPVTVTGGLKIRCSVSNTTAQITNYPGTEHTYVSAGNVEVKNMTSVSDIDLQGILSVCDEQVDMNDVYQHLQPLGAEFGPKFRNLQQVWKGKNEAVASIRVSKQVAWEESLRIVHPAILDAAIQLLTVCSIQTSAIFIPFYVKRAYIATVDEQRELWAHVRLTKSEVAGLVGHVEVTDAQGRCIALLDEIRCQRIGTDQKVGDCLYEVEWSLVPAENNQEIRDLEVERKWPTNNRNILILSAQIVAEDSAWETISFQMGEENSRLTLEEDNARNKDLLQRLGELAITAEKIVLLAGVEDNVLSVAKTACILLKFCDSSLLQMKCPDIWFVSMSCPEEFSEPLCDGAASCLWAMAQTARMEMSNLSVHCVQCPQFSGPSFLQSITSVISSSSTFKNERLLYTPEGGLRVARLSRMKNKTSVDQYESLQISAESTYVVSGGLGALGRLVATWLVQSNAKYIVLLSHRENQAEPIELQRLQNQFNFTARVEYCDVRRQDHLKQLKQRLEVYQWPEVAGIFHTAGVLKDSTIRNLELQNFEETFGPKMHGAKNLYETFKSFDFMILFSSAAAAFGSVGQTCYAAANAAMDALANKWTYVGHRVLSIQWGAWAEVGMAADDAIIKRAERYGFEAITNELGRNLLEHLLKNQKSGTVCAVPVNWGRVVSTDHIYKQFSFLSESNSQTTSILSTYPAQPLTVDQISNAIVKVTKELLGKELDEDVSLIEAGLDSLGAIEFRNLLSNELHIHLPSIIVYNQTTRRKLVTHILARGTQKKDHEEPVTETSDSYSEEPIAVIGMACRFPGNVSNPAEFWQILQQGKDCVTDIPASRFDIEKVFSSDINAVGKSYTRKGAFMNGVEWFDHEYFSIPYSEARVMDPQQRILTEVSNEAFVNAGYGKSRIAGSKTGVFVGQANYDWLSMTDHNVDSPFFGAGTTPSITANRLSYLFDLHGPSLTVDTACSSSLVALDVAVKSLRSSQSSMALVAGVNVMLSSLNYVGSCAAQMLSPSGRCATFDNSADGYCRGEGVGCIVLKPLTQALSDGDNIMALIRGTAVNQDGRSAVLTAPNGPAQEAVIHSALNSAGVRGNEIDYIECHGTGTSLGDPIEFESLKNVLNDEREIPLVLGAVKTNIGHLEGAAGIAGVIKTILVLMNRAVPPNLHFKVLNSKIDLNGFNVLIPTKCISLTPTRKTLRLRNEKTDSNLSLLAGVSSFGFGGTNAHTILQAWDLSTTNACETSVNYNRAFIPWYRLTHPLVYSREIETGYSVKITDEHAQMFKDHSINGRILFPAASHMIMMAGTTLELSRKNKKSRIGVVLEDIVLAHQIEPGKCTELQCRFSNERTEVSCNVADEITTIASASSAKVVDQLNGILSTVVVDARRRCIHPTDAADVYEQFTKLGASFGPKFRLLTQVYRGDREAVACTGLVKMTTLERALQLIHPYILDSSFQLLGICAMNNCGLCVPFHAKRMTLYTVVEQTNMQVCVKIKEQLPNSVTGDICIVSSTGELVAVVEDLYCRQTQHDQSDVLNCLFETEWIDLKPSDLNLRSSFEIPLRVDNREQEVVPSSLILTFGNVLAHASDWAQWACVKSIDENDILVQIHFKDSNNDDSSPVDHIPLRQVLQEGRWKMIALFADVAGKLDTVKVGLALLQGALLAQNTSCDCKTIPEIWFVTSANDYVSAGLWGLARTARLELPDFHTRCLLYEATISSTNIEELCTVLGTLAGTAENEFRLSENKTIIHIPRLRQARKTNSQNPVDIRNGYSATYIVTGGMGALGLTVTTWLIDSGASHIILLSRSNDSEKLELLRSRKLHRQTSLHIEWIQCDVSSLRSVEVTQRRISDLGWPAVAGIIHTAGTLSDATLRTLESKSLETVYDSKLSGAVNLHQTFKNLEFFVLFSSAAALFGSPGQANYAAANASLDSFAEYCSKRLENVLSIQWGAWSDAGMATKTGAVERARRSGFGSLTDETGKNILQLLICGVGKSGTVCATPIDWKRISMKSRLLDNYMPLQQSKLTVRTEQKGSSDIRQRQFILEMVRRIAHSVLGLSDKSDDIPLVDAGMDSLSAIEFRNQLAEEMNVDIPSVFAFNYTTISDMVEKLVAMTSGSYDVDRTLPTTACEKSREPVAIVGMACRFPGGVESPEDFWQMLLEARDCVTDIPNSRFSISDVYDPVPGRTGKSYTSKGAFMKNVEWFDNEFFGISRAEAEAMDPQQRILLEVGYEAFVKAGYDKRSLKGLEAGVFVGQMNYDFMMSQGIFSPSYGGTGFSPAISSNRLSFAFGLRGPSLTIDTACSSSLVALDSAVEKISAGKCELALVAGVNVMLQAANFVGSSAANMLSHTGRCATFDASADGYCRGEGVGCIVLKSLSKAKQDGNSILAVIKGSAVNQDGRSASLTAPNGPAQEDVIRHALSEANLQGSSLDYVECHGTGTKLGDPIEVAALKNVLSVSRTKPVVLGAVKTNIGHLEGAAGIASVIKTVLVLQHAEAPPNLHFRSLNPKIDLSNFQAIIPVDQTPLLGEVLDESKSALKRVFYAGVSSFGFGGTNAHVILQSWPDETLKPESMPNTAFLFTGQGSQFTGMGKALYDKNEVFKNCLDRCAGQLESMIDIPLLELLFSELQQAHLSETKYSQPAILSIQYALFSMMIKSKNGKLPTIVIGHSIGEYAAAVCCGVMKIEDALFLVCQRGRLMEERCPIGAMAAVFAPAEKIRSTLVRASTSSEVTISAINGPNQTVLSGTESGLASFLNGLDVTYKTLQVQRGFHSPLMSAMLEEFRQQFVNVTLRPPTETITFISSVTGLPVKDELCSPEYWVEQIVKAVDFQSAMTTATTLQNISNFVEIGPKPVLIPMAKRFIKRDSDCWITAIDEENFSLAKKENFSTRLYTNRQFIPLRAKNTAATVQSVNQSVEQILELNNPAAENLYEIRWEYVKFEWWAVKSTSNNNGNISSLHCLFLSLNNASCGGSSQLTRYAYEPEKFTTEQEQRSDIKEISHITEEIMQDKDTVLVLVPEITTVDVVQLGVRVLQVASSLASNSRSLKIWFIIQESADSNLSNYCGHGLRALLKTARLELQNLRIQSIIVPSKASLTDIAAYCDKITTQYDRTDGDFRVTLDGDLQIERLVLLELPSARNSSPVAVSNNATYLITGGRGALGEVTCKWLAQLGAKYIIRCSRSVPKETSRQNITQLNGWNEEVNVKDLACDVSSLDQVQKLQDTLVELEWPSVRGVIHAAGALHDATILKLGKPQIEEVFHTKVDGAKHLHQTFGQLDFFIMFSSAASVFGSPGQANYAAANGAMDELAELWHGEGQNALSIQWGAWSDGGMAVNANAVRRVQGLGFGTISNTLGTEILDVLLVSGKLGNVCATPISWSKVKLDTSLVANFVTVSQETKVISRKFYPAGHRDRDSIVEIKAALRTISLDVLGATVADNESLIDTGMDSLAAVEFRNRLSEEFGVQLPSGILFDFPSISSLSQHLRELVEQPLQGHTVNYNSIEDDRELLALPVVVIGAGLGGICFANQLTKVGQKVIVLEAKSEIGGVWQMWANQSSKLQIDAPSYDIDCLDQKNTTTWGSIFPNRKEILFGAHTAVENFERDSLLLNCEAQSVQRVADNEYIVQYEQHGIRHEIHCSGVAAFTGGLHELRHLRIDGEERFRGLVARGVSDDLSELSWKNANVVIIGHGAYAIENMRTAFENGAKHVTIVCRKRTLVVTTFCNWILNSSEGNMPIKLLLAILEPFYSAAGVDIHSLSCFSFENDEIFFDQETVPPASDLYFMAQALNKLKVVEDEVDHLVEDGVSMRSGAKLTADIVIKCIGFETNASVLAKVFGKNHQVDGLWVDGDRNLFAYNDGRNISRKVRSLLCSSYLFFVQTYAKVYMRYRLKPQLVSLPINDTAQGNESGNGRLTVQLWDFLAPAKKVVAERTRKFCAFENFLAQREKEWYHWLRMLSPAECATSALELWKLIQPVLQEVRRREPQKMLEDRYIFRLQESSVYLPTSRYRVLFLHGQGTNARLATHLLESNGWTGQLKDVIEFVIPDAPHKMSAFTNKQQLAEIGLDTLVEEGIYKTNEEYREWRADYDWFAEQHTAGSLCPKLESDLNEREQNWNSTLEYIRSLSTRFGPFDGIAGFCEGSAVASVVLHLQDAYSKGDSHGIDVGLSSVKFFIAIAAWRNPHFEHKHLFSHEHPLGTPSIHIVGRQDMEMFRHGAPIFIADFKNPEIFEHNGKHVYPPLSSKLKSAIHGLLTTAKASSMH